MLVRLDRNSVAAGDDVYSHVVLREIDGRRPLERVVAELMRDGYLPRISGGSSCWVMRRARQDERIGIATMQDRSLQVFRLEGLASLLVHEIGPPRRS